MPGMTRDAALALIERRHAAWAARDADALSATHTADGIVVSPTGGVLEGRDEIARVYRLWFSAFADIAFVNHEVLVDGERVAEFARLSGTHSGDFFGLAPTGRKVEVQVALLMTL